MRVRKTELKNTLMNLTKIIILKIIVNKFLIS